MRLIILGAGGYGRTVADIAAQTGQFDEISFLDDNSTTRDVIGKCAEFERFYEGQTAFYPAFGNNEMCISDRCCPMTKCPLRYIPMPWFQLRPR